MHAGPKLILLRHGESVWNRRNLFTGWVDVPLSPAGIEEALNAGSRISFIPIDIIFVSSLVRSQLTAMIAMSVHRKERVPVFVDHERKEWATNYNPDALKMTIPTVVAWEINERMYGELQGLDKDEMRKKFGVAKVETWRRSFDIPPPNGESLEDTARRALSYFKDRIVPQLQEGKNVLVAAHGNSLRSIFMFIDHLSKEQVVKLEVPTGEPICYSYDKSVWKREDVDDVQYAYQKEF